MNHPFDEFSKSLSEESVPRRESLRRLGAVFVSAILGPLALGVESASANPDNRRRWRRPRRRPLFPPLGGKDKCASFCKRCRTKRQKEQCLSACNNPNRLKGSCGNYVCCSDGQTYCKGSCVDLQNDPGNCGSCGRTCPADQECVQGNCRDIACPPDQTRCATTCVDLAFDNNNCGSCGNVCGGSTPYCVSGTCSECLLGQVKCDGVCSALNWDVSNCGACGNVCPASTPYCEGGVCVECPSSYPTSCYGICTDVSYDWSNCGACGVVCADYEICFEGACILYW
jgi:hypothetical protein